MKQSDYLDGYEALMQFLYRAPIGLVQTSLEGNVEMLNPMASSLLMPLAPDGGLDNLFTVLEQVAPQLRGLTAGYELPSGVLCEAMRLPLGAVGAPQVLSISLLKLDPLRLMAVVTDATLETRREQETLSRRLKSAARTDTLTKMPNRAAVREQLQLMMARPAKSAEFALLLMNCDRFRHLNDRLGQAAGDPLLIQIAERVRATLRLSSDSIDVAGSRQLAARVGGDEFVVVLDGMRRLEDAERVALRLLDAIDKPFQVLGQQIVCTVSMGLVWGALPATPTRRCATPTSRCARPSEVAATAMPYSRQ
jgi:diguanylate cyclase (GGDEF)-like protein